MVEFGHAPDSKQAADCQSVFVPSTREGDYESAKTSEVILEGLGGLLLLLDDFYQDLKDVLTLAAFGE